MIEKFPKLIKFARSNVVIFKIPTAHILNHNLIDYCKILLSLSSIPISRHNVIILWQTDVGHLQSRQSVFASAVSVDRTS